MTDVMTSPTRVAMDLAHTVLDRETYEHSSRLAQRLRPEGPKLQTIAWLHDVLEDYRYLYTTDFANMGFSSTVVEAVVALTRDRSHLESYADYINRVAKNRLARRVKIADLEDHLDPVRIHNIPESQAVRYVKALHHLALLK